MGQMTVYDENAIILYDGENEIEIEFFEVDKNGFIFLRYCINNGAVRYISTELYKDNNGHYIATDFIQTYYDVKKVYLDEMLLDEIGYEI